MSMDELLLAQATKEVSAVIDRNMTVAEAADSAHAQARSIAENPWNSFAANPDLKATIFEYEKEAQTA